MEIGEAIPDFSLEDQDGNVVSKSDFEGSSVVLFFYPRAMTPGCTTEACDFRDNYDAFREAGYAVVGVSPDPPQRNARFRDKEGLTFPLLSDPDHVLAEPLGAWGTKKGYGKIYNGLIRSTYVMDENGILVRAWQNVRAKGHVSRITDDLDIF